MEVAPPLKMHHCFRDAVKRRLALGSRGWPNTQENFMCSETDFTQEKVNFHATTGISNSSSY